MSLCTKSTPQEYFHYLQKRHIDYIIAGTDHMDLRKALVELYSRYAVRVVRVDAGRHIERPAPPPGAGK